MDERNATSLELADILETENKLLHDAVEFVCKDAEQTEMLVLTELALGVLLRAAEIDQVTDDGKAVSAIVARVFNTTAGALRAALTGYYQTAFVLMRDLHEIRQLVDYFTLQPDTIARWREVTNEERLNEFRQAAFRNALDERDGVIDSARSREYKLLSEHAAHLTYPALRFLRSPDGHTRVGPYFDAKYLRAALWELGRHVTACETVILRALPNTMPHSAEEAAILMKDRRTLDDLRRKYYGA